jgi:hypothetical protein
MRPHLVLITAGLLASALLATVAPRSEAATVLLVAAILATAVGAIIALVNAGADRSDATKAGGESKAMEATFGVLGILVVALILNVGLTLVILWARGELTDGAADPPAGLKPRLLQYLSVGVFAGAVGFSELVGRYRDDPYRLIGLTPAGVYVWINVAAGVLALALVQQFNVLGAPANGTPPPAIDPNLKVKEALLAAFGAIAFFRTSFFTTKVGDKEIGIGPSALLKAFLESCDRLVNRDQAKERAKIIEDVMKDVDFAKAKSALPSLCLVLFEGLDADEQQALGEQIARLDENKDMDNAAKGRILGAYLLRKVGPDVVKEAVRTLGDRITYDKPPPAPPPAVPPLAEPADPAP